ncbi:serine hydrolase [bacterium]|nr:serine hydrolase [bacterium]
MASAAKPFYSFFLFKAVEQDKIPRLNQPVSAWEPQLKQLNPDLENKDKHITWRHMANQTSCYGLKENPGTAFAYNDWQMALFWDLLFLEVYKTTYAKVDEEVFHPLLTAKIGCEDNPTMMAFGVNNRPGRVAISPRDFARFGLLFLHQGEWKGERILNKKHAVRAVSSPLPADLPRAGNQAAEMLKGQRSIGSRNIPDNQCPHEGSYSWLWWINGVDQEGNRRWPGAPHDVFSALGHKNGKRGMAVLPTQKIVIAWNDTRLDRLPQKPHPLNEVFRLLMEAKK